MKKRNFKERLIDSLISVAAMAPYAAVAPVIGYFGADDVWHMAAVAAPIFLVCFVTHVAICLSLR